MRIVNLTNGEKAIVIKSEFLIKRTRFILALTDYYYRYSEKSIEELTKKEAEKILRNELFHFGMQGEYHAGFFEASFEEGGKRNDVWQICEAWVDTYYTDL